MKSVSYAAIEGIRMQARTYIWTKPRPKSIACEIDWSLSPTCVVLVTDSGQEGRYGLHVFGDYTSCPEG
jgi:hypothetical protein